MQRRVAHEYVDRWFSWLISEVEVESFQTTFMGVRDNSKAEVRPVGEKWREDNHYVA